MTTVNGVHYANHTAKFGEGGGEQGSESAILDEG